MSDDEERKMRAEARRRTAVLHRTRLHPVEHDLDPISGASAISLVARLTMESWSESGRPFPTYERREAPVRFVPGRLT